MPKLIKIWILIASIVMPIGVSATSVYDSKGREIIPAVDTDQKVFLRPGVINFTQRKECTDTRISWLYTERNCSGSESYRLLLGEIIPTITEPTEGERVYRYETIGVIAGMALMVLAMVLKWWGFLVAATVTGIIAIGAVFMISIHTFASTIILFATCTIIAFIALMTVVHSGVSPWGRESKVFYPVAGICEVMMSVALYNIIL